MMEIAAQSGQVLGTHVEIKLPSAASSFFPICFSELSRIEQNFSRFLSTSELSHINSRLGAWQDVSAELLSLVLRAEEFRTLTDGYFDISLKSRLDALGYDKNYSFKPNQSAPARPSADSPAFEIDIANSRIFLKKEIEFGGLGKGYAIDKVGQLLQNSGVSHYYINAGGDILSKRGEDAEPWIILLEHPDDFERAIGKIELDGRSIAGSAPNRRKWGENGQMHHLLNAKTQMPARGAKAIFVTAKTGIEADAYATAVFTAGFEEGIALSQKLPVEILFISDKDEMYTSDGFGAEMFY